MKQSRRRTPRAEKRTSSDVDYENGEGIAMLDYLNFVGTIDV
jgi:hypothetical protein